MENLINDNSDSHIIVGGDFNVNFSRNRIHIAMLSSFCTNLILTPAIHHVKNTVYYTCNFNMSRFGILDHFFVDIIFDKSVISHHVIHDVDNFSDHKPILCFSYVLR